MTDYIVTTDTPAALMRAKGAEVITRCKHCDNYKYGYCYRLVRGSMCRHPTKPNLYCAWAEPKQ